MKSDAVLTPCRKYRYALWRIWDDDIPYAMFIGLNPSTADELENDRTVNRCIDFARSWGYGGLCMSNLFAFRATKPSDMFAAKEPIGTDNDAWLIKLASEAGVVVAAWGNDGVYLNRSRHVVGLLPNLHYLKKNISGEPSHPLYLGGDLKPILFTIPSK